MNLDEITTGSLTSVSDLMDLNVSLIRSGKWRGPWTEFDLQLKKVNKIRDLEDEGRHLIIVALIQTDRYAYANLHVRIFDGNGEKVFDKSENDLIGAESLTSSLKERLNPFPDWSLSGQKRQEIIDAATEIAGHTPWAFRGQPNVYGTLVPSFQRIFTAKKSVNAAERIEGDLIKTFREHYAKLTNRTPDMPRPDEIGEGSELRCLSVMQHYGVPTRLLDWTGSFWTAVYFACTSDPTNDAELWYYDRTIFQPKTEEKSDPASLAAPISATQPEGDFLKQGTGHIAELDYRLTPRMREQVAHHTVSSDIFADHAPLLRKLDASGGGFRRMLIESRCKRNALKYLAEYESTTAGTIFPDVEGLGRFLHWHLETLITTFL